MRHVTACLLCGETDLQRHIEIGCVTGANPYGLSSLQGQAARFVVCVTCGFVFQNPTLDDSELLSLYGGEYRTFDPPSGYLAQQEQIAGTLCDWIDRLTHDQLPYRRVLDIGCGAGCFLREFKRRGWDVVGIDASARWTEWGRRQFDLDLRTGFFGEEGLPGEQFSLVLFSHVIEHMPNPIPVLHAIRRCVDQSGYVFVGAPNILLPPDGNLGNNFMAGPHVCLYSPRTIRRMLAKVGFEVCRQDNWYPRGLRVLAKPCGQSTSPKHECGIDDWKIIRGLYEGLTRRSAASLFARNLAALLPHHHVVAEELAAKPAAGGTRVIKKDGTVVNLEIATSSGGLRLLVEIARREQVTQPAMSPRDVSRGSLVVLIGLGFGDLALKLLPLLKACEANLFIYEPDPLVVRTAFTVRDFTLLLSSPQVGLCVGRTMRVKGRDRNWFRGTSHVLWLMDEQVNPVVRQDVYATARDRIERWRESLRAPETVTA